MAGKGQKKLYCNRLEIVLRIGRIAKKEKLDPMTTNLVVADKSRTERLSVWQCLLP